MYCNYYQARVVKETTWFVCGVIRNEENIAFARGLEGFKDILEIFVPQDQDEPFVHLMDYCVKHGYVISYEKLPNRLIEQDTR